MLTDRRPPRQSSRGQHRGPRSGAPRAGHDEGGLFYQPDFVSAQEEDDARRWLATLHPIWEMRYSTHRPPPSGQPQRRLLRPVYWLGNWQFACLDYYRAPHGVHDRCVAAEPFPPVLQEWVRRIEEGAHSAFARGHVPDGWHLNTCLINFYGSRLDGQKWIDSARVGEHRDFEPGPVGSVSLGERALIQFVTSQPKRALSECTGGGVARLGQHLRSRTGHRPGERENVAAQQWLDHRGLQVFAGPQWKDRTFHRVQRVDRREGHDFALQVDGFRTRRVNFTFRYVPEQHVIPYHRLSLVARDDVRDYMRALAQHSQFFRKAIEAAGESAGPG